MKNSANISASLGLTQYEMAMLLGVTRSQWSMFELGKRSLPLQATQKLAALLLYVQENDAKFKKSEFLDETQKEQLRKQRLIENEFEQLQIQKKMDQLQKQEAAQLHLTILADFLSQSRTNDPYTMHPIIFAKAKRKYVRPKETWQALALRLEVLQAEQSFLRAELDR